MNKKFKKVDPCSLKSLTLHFDSGICSKLLIRRRTFTLDKYKDEIVIFFHKKKYSKLV